MATKIKSWSATRVLSGGSYISIFRFKMSQQVSYGSVGTSNQSYHTAGVSKGAAFCFPPVFCTSRICERSLQESSGLFTLTGLRLLTRKAVAPRETLQLGPPHCARRGTCRPKCRRVRGASPGARRGGGTRVCVGRAGPGGGRVGGPRRRGWPLPSPPLPAPPVTWLCSHRH